jgi:hypothetical protein
VLYWFQLVRGPKGVDYVPHRIDNESGVGTQVVAGDINGDKLPDVVIGNKKGVFVLTQALKEVDEEEWLAAQPKALPPPKLVKSINPAAADGRALNFGFEEGSLRDWQSEGKAFEGPVIKGDAVAARRKDMRSNHKGERWVGSYEQTNSDTATGTLTSVPFPVTQPYASFLIGGGASLKTRVEIVNALNDTVLFRATGPDNEAMKRVSVDLQPWAGASIRIRVVDEATTGWGHVNFDDFVFHDGPPPKMEPVASALNAK